MSKIKIVADSTCDLSPELVKRYDVEIVPLFVALDDKIYRDGKEITFDLGNVPVLAIWSNNKMGKYACIEAWWGLPDTVDCDRELKNKFLINTLPAGKTFEYEVTVTF